jgi:hypothetical protein
MDNKDPWVSYDKVSTNSDAFAYVQEIGNDLSDSLEHLNQGSPVRAKGLPTEKYTAGNTNDVMEGVHEESFLTQTPSKISRRYSPMSKSEYSGYRPPDPVFLSYNNNQTTNTFLPEPLVKHKNIEDIDKVQVNNKFVVNKLSSANREAAIAPEALELINILNPVEAREIQNTTTIQQTVSEKYTSSITPIEVKKVETKTNTIIEKSAPIIIGKPKTLITYNQVENNNQINNQSSNNYNSSNIETNTSSLNVNNISQENIQNDINQENYQTLNTNNTENTNISSSVLNANNYNESNTQTNINQNNVQSNANQINNSENIINNNESNNVEMSGPIFKNNSNQINNQASTTLSTIEIKKPVVTPKLSQYTNTIDFNSFVSSTFAEIVDQKTEQKILSKNNINVRKLVTDINLFLEQNKKEFKNNVSNSVNQLFSTYSEENLTTLQNSISNTIINSNNVENLYASVSRVVNEYFSKNQNDFNQSLVAEFVESFNINLQTQLANLQNNSTAEFNIIQNINSVISDIQNIYESKQAEIAKVISEVNNDNVLSKVVELANTYQDYQALTTQSINNISSQVNQTNISELKETFINQVSNVDVKSQTALSTFKQEIYGFLYTYLSNSVEQDTLNNVINSVTNSNSVEQVNSVINKFVSSIKTEENSQTVNSLQYFSNDKYSNIVSGLMIETVENNVLNSLSSLVQNYSNQDNIQNTLVNQVKSELAELFTSEVKNTVNKFGLTELKTSIENVYKSQDINEFKSEFNNVLNKSENSSNSQLISYLNNLLENNISQYTSKSANVLNETRYANSVKNLVNENLHNVVSNIVHNLSEVNTYSDNKNISTLLNNIKIINDRLLINNAENRLQNFNLIQTSIENFLNNTENNYNEKLSQIKLNTTNISPEILTNINVFESLNSDVNNEHLTEVKNIISNTDTQNFNEESNSFFSDVKLYTDLINMKNQITSELDNFVSSTFETILEVNQSSTLVSTQQIVNLVEEAVTSFNTSNVSSQAISYIQTVLQDVKKPELYNNTFQLITSTNILEEQVKNYLLQNNSVLADFSLQQIINTINQPMYSDYVTFQDIKEVINKSTSSSSFGILSEVKQYINQVNSQENAQFISNLKTYLSDNQTNNTSVNNVNFTDQLKYFISEQNSYSPETFNQVINSVTNKFENKSALILNEIINENVSKLNQVLDTLYSSVTNNQSKESILNTLSTFVNNNVSYGDTDNNFLTEQTNNFKQENSEFIENLNNVLLKNNSIISDDIKNDIKTQIFNNISNQVLAVLNKNNVSVEELNTIIKNTSTVENKTEEINSYLSKLENIYQDSSFVNDIKYAQSFLNRESVKIDVVNNSDKLNIENLDTTIQNVISKNILELQKTYVISNSTMNKIEEFKNIVNNANSLDIVNNFSNEIISSTFNDSTVNFLDTVETLNISSDLKQQIINQVNSSSNLTEIKNTLNSNSNLFSSLQTFTLESTLNESLLISNLINSVNQTFNSEILNNKNNVEIYVNIALVEYLQNKFTSYQSFPVYKSETYLESLSKFIESNVSNPSIVLNTVKEVAGYASGDKASINNLIKTVENLYQSGTFNTVQNRQNTYETFEKNNLEFLTTVNNTFSDYNVSEVLTTLNNLSADIVTSAQTNIENITKSTSTSLDISSVNIQNLDDVKSLINNINEYQNSNNVSTKEEIILNSVKNYVANEYVKINMLQNLISQATDIKSVYSYNVQNTNELNLSQEEEESIIQQENQEFLNQYTQQFINENLSSSSFAANITRTLANNFAISNLSTLAVEVVNNINSLTTSSEINNYATKLEENSFNEAKSILTSILNDLGKTEISQMIINSANSVELKNIIQNNFTNLNTVEKNIAEKTLNEAFYVSNRLNEAINIFNQDIKENSLNISSYVATQTLTNLIQNYISEEINNSSLSIINNMPKVDVNQAYTLANVLSVINKEDVVNNLLSLNQNTFNNNRQESSYSVVSFKFDQEFKDTVQNIATSTNTENIATELNTFKQEIFNNAVSTVNEVMNQSNTKVESYDSVVKNQTLTVDEKIENILKTFNVALSNQSLSAQEVKNIELVRNYLLNESYKIELINQVSSQDSFVVNKFDQEFRNTVQNIVTSTNTENIATELNMFKQEIFNNAISTVNEIMNQSNIKLDSYNTIVENKTISVDDKMQVFLKTFNKALDNQSLFEENKNLENIKNYVLNESYKIEFLNRIASQDLFVANKFDEFENEISTKIKQYLISPSFVENVNSFRNEISRKNSINEVKQYSSEQKIIILNDVKSLVSDFISVVKPEYLNTENLNTINDANSVEQISNLLTENNNQFTTSENSTISNIINQSSAYYQIVDSVTSSILNDRNFTENTLMQKVDNAIYNTVQNQFNTISTSLIQNVINKFEQSYATTNTFEESVSIASSIVNNSILNFDKYFKEVLNSFKIENIEEKINNYNQDVIRTVNTAVQNYDVSKLLTNTINENISMSQSIVNSDVIENINQVLQENNISSSESISSKDLINNVTSNQLITQQIQNTINSNTVRNLFNRSLINELTRNTSMLRTVLSEKTQGSQINLNTEYLNKIYSSVNNVKSSVVNDIKNEVEKIENITLNFENQTNYQRSSIQIYDEVTNRTETSLHPGFDKVNLDEKTYTSETVSNNNEFKNITVVKQIDENEDVQVSNLRIEKVWNQFVQEEVNKIVEEVNNSSETQPQNNVYNNITNVENNTTSENSNTSQTYIYSGDTNKSEYYNVSNKFENINSVNPTGKSFDKLEKSVQREIVTEEVIQKINYQEITDIVFTRVEQKLKSYNVTNEDIILLKHRILTEVAEYYEKKSKYDQERTENKLKKEMENLFIKFLNS